MRGVVRRSGGQRRARRDTSEPRLHRVWRHARASSRKPPVTCATEYETGEARKRGEHRFGRACGVALVRARREKAQKTYVSSSSQTKKTSRSSSAKLTFPNTDYRIKFRLSTHSEFRPVRTYKLGGSGKGKTAKEYRVWYGAASTRSFPTTTALRHSPRGARVRPMPPPHTRRPRRPRGGHRTKRHDGRGDAAVAATAPPRHRHVAAT